MASAQLSPAPGRSSRRLIVVGTIRRSATRPALRAVTYTDGRLTHIDERHDADLTAVATAVGVLYEPATVAACRRDYEQARAARANRQH